jgi:hypothetical protein
MYSINQLVSAMVKQNVNFTYLVQMLHKFNTMNMEIGHTPIPHFIYRICYMKAVCKAKFCTGKFTAVQVFWIMYLPDLRYTQFDCY